MSGNESLGRPYLIRNVYVLARTFNTIRAKRSIPYDTKRTFMVMTQGKWMHVMI